MALRTVSRFASMGLESADKFCLIFLSTFCLGAVVYLIMSSRKKERVTVADNRSLKVLPSPPKFPFLGHLHLLRGNPFIAMTQLAKTFGPIYSLQLGSVPTVVVNSVQLMKKILVEQGGSFLDRPDFYRYRLLFGNDKENSLAFCNYSRVQKKRRNLARRFCHSPLLNKDLQMAIETSGNHLIQCIENDRSGEQPHLNLKLHLQKACANIFFEYFCSQRFDEETDLEFENTVKNFDEIFWEINQSHPTDVLPFLAPLFSSHLQNLVEMGKQIRQFVEEKIINIHFDRLNTDDPQDFVDTLLCHLQDVAPDTRLTQEQILYMLEDFIGGHSAVSNLLGRMLVEIASVEGLAGKIYEKHFVEGNSDYIQAVLYETLRKTSSPIVPHVASEETIIEDYRIEKGTMVIMNNYELNTSPEYWSNPEAFIPERFLTSCGVFHKPGHFMPFSTGVRACMGYKLVEKIATGITLSIVRNFDLCSMENPCKLPISCVAIPPSTNLRVTFTPRL